MLCSVYGKSNLLLASLSILSFSFFLPIAILLQHLSLQQIDEFIVILYCFLILGSYGVPVNLQFNLMKAYLLSKGWILMFAHVR